MAEMLYKPAALAADFVGLHILENHALGVMLHEASFHTGSINVVRPLGVRDSSSKLTYCK